jgi:hypothetical protein
MGFSVMSVFLRTVGAWRALHGATGTTATRTLLLLPFREKVAAAG